MKKPSPTARWFAVPAKAREQLLADLASNAMDCEDRPTRADELAALRAAIAVLRGLRRGDV